MKRKALTLESVEAVLYELIEHFNLDYHRGVILENILKGGYGDVELIQKHANRLAKLEPKKIPMPDGAITIADTLNHSRLTLPPVDSDPQPLLDENGELKIHGEY